MASFPAHIYLCCLKPCNPSGPNSCLITLLGCLLSSGWEILVGLSRMGFSCSSSGLALPGIHFQASAYSASRCTRDLTGRAGLLVELGLLTTPMLVGLLRMRLCGGAPWEGCRPESQWALWEEIWISPLSAAFQLSGTSSSSILLTAFGDPQFRVCSWDGLPFRADFNIFSVEKHQSRV